MSNNRLCKTLEIEKPIIQGPMAWVATPPLVAAVSNAGGLGVLGVGFAPPDFVAAQIVETRKLTKKPFGLNVMMIPDRLDAITEVALREKPDIIYADIMINLDSSLCQKYFQQWKAAGMKIIVKASTMRDAVTANENGADVIVMKGWEGGGHVTSEATTVLVPQAADTLTVPIVAAGGIADGRGMAAAIALGADGVEMGTVFMCAAETDIHENAKDAVMNAKDMDTVITGVSTGEPCRQLKNKLSDKMQEIEANNLASVSAEQVRALAKNSLRKAMLEGEVEYDGAVMAGQIAPLVKQIRPASEIIDSTILECKAILRQIQKFEY